VLGVFGCVVLGVLGVFGFWGVLGVFGGCGGLVILYLSARETERQEVLRE